MIPDDRGNRMYQLNNSQHNDRKTQMCTNQQQQKQLKPHSQLEAKEGRETLVARNIGSKLVTWRALKTTNDTGR